MSRHWRVDTLRGYFLVIMTIAHLPANPLRRFTSYTFGYASAPDGFVFLSGLVCAWVYLRDRHKNGAEAVRVRARRRARDIYLVHILLLSLGIVAAALAKDSSFQAIHPFQTFVRGSLLLYQPRMSDILPMYCIFLLFTPFVLGQMVEGRAWVIGVISAALWTAAKCGVGDASSKLIPWIQVGAFNILAWQAYFVCGQYFGYRTLQGGKIPRSRILLAVCIGLSLLFFLDRHSEFFFGIKALLKFNPGPDSNPARFLDAAALGYIIWWIPGSIDQALTKLRLFRFVNELGRHSLQVFAFSLFIAFGATVFSRNWDLQPTALKVLLVGMVVLSLGIPARLHQMYRDRRAPQDAGVVRYSKVLQGQAVNLL